MLSQFFPATGLTAHQTGASSIGLTDAARALVAVTIALSGIVFSEPAPVDLLMIGVIVLLPVAGLQTYSTPLIGYLLLWLACGSGALLASAQSTELARSTIHTGVSFYLYAMSFTLAAFVAHRPVQHAELILRASVAGALLAAVAAIVGYFHLLPGAFDLFTKFGRAAGTFKDPNVLGPFLVPAILYCAHVAIVGTWRTARVVLAIAGFLSLAVLLSFSRGAWINLAIAVVVFGYLAFVTAVRPQDRHRLVTIGGAALLAMSVVVVGALQIESVADLMEHRSSLSQGYDVGPEGRFGGQEKAQILLLDNPLGIGATQFSLLHHHEDVHNVYLSMFLNAGWLGGLLYCAVVALTLAFGLLHLARATACRPLFVIAFAAFLGNVVEGVVIDTDHWRHFYVLLAILWGLMCAPANQREASRA